MQKVLKLPVEILRQSTPKAKSGAAADTLLTKPAEHRLQFEMPRFSRRFMRAAHGKIGAQAIRSPQSSQAYTRDWELL
jgi:hypothetical protein